MINANRVPTSGIGFSPDGLLLAAMAVGFSPADTKVRMWDLGKGDAHVDLLDPRFHPEAAAFLPDGKSMVVGTHKGVHLWSAPGGKLIGGARCFSR